MQITQQKSFENLQNKNKMLTSEVLNLKRSVTEKVAQINAL